MSEPENNADSKNTPINNKKLLSLWWTGMDQSDMLMQAAYRFLWTDNW